MHASKMFFFGIKIQKVYVMKLNIGLSGGIFLNKRQTSWHGDTI